MQPYMHITQDKKISPTSLKHLALYLKEQLLIKGQKCGQKYHKQSDYIKTRIPSLDYKKRLHHQIQLNVLLMLYIELLGNIIVLSSVGGMRGCVVAVAVMSPRGWVCLGETLVFVCLLPVLMSCVRSCSGWVRPVLSRWCSLVLPAVCECAHGRWADPSR